MGNNCGPLVADLSLFSYERDFRYCLFLTIVKLIILLNRSTLVQDVKMPFPILIILVQRKNGKSDNS